MIHILPIRLYQRITESSNLPTPRRQAIFNLFSIYDSNKATGKSQQSILYFNLFPTILVRAMIRKRKTRSLKTEIIARSHQWCAPGLRCFMFYFIYFFFTERFHSFDLWAVASAGAIFNASHCVVHARRGRLQRFVHATHLY